MRNSQYIWERYLEPLLNSWIFQKNAGIQARDLESRGLSDEVRYEIARGIPRQGEIIGETPKGDMIKFGDIVIPNAPNTWGSEEQAPIGKAAPVIHFGRLSGDQEIFFYLLYGTGEVRGIFGRKRGCESLDGRYQSKLSQIMLCDIRSCERVSIASSTPPVAVAPPKFEVGSAVRRVASTYLFGVRVTSGENGLVSEILPDGTLRVDFQSQKGWYADPSDIELVVSPAK